MLKDLKIIPSFDDIVFEIRNKDYGAYSLRKKYNRNVLIALLIGITSISIAVITPYLNAKALETSKRRAEKLIEIKMENLDQPQEKIEPPAPPPPAETVAPLKYVAPVVVDSVKPEDVKQMMTADQAQVEVKNEDVQVVQQVQEEVKEEETPPEPFVVVEEMPSFPGGDQALQKYIGENVVYPQVARENNIQGRVIIKFCVTPTGGVDQVSILKGVDPELDAEVIRVVKTLPRFKPGKQGGKPVPVWHTVPVYFHLIENHI